MLDKELHIWMGENYPSIHELSISLELTETALESGWPLVHTPQPSVCSTKWLERGYRIFVHMLDNEVVEMKLGHIEGCMKEIRIAHNLERMMLSGMFGKSTIVKKV